MARKKTDLSKIDKPTPKQSTALRGGGDGPSRAIDGFQLTLDQIKHYENNPRRVKNPKYETIKSSIKQIGLETKLQVTKRPGEDFYTLAFGGNTRLSILKELYEETGDKSFYNQKVDYIPFTDELSLIVKANIENDMRSDVSFFDKAASAILLRDHWLEQSGETSMTSRGLADLCDEKGMSNVSQTIASIYIYTIENLASRIPLILSEGSFGKDRVKMLRKRDTTIKKCASSIAGGDAVNVMRELWFGVLAKHDDPETYDLDLIWSRFAREVSEHYDISLALVETQLQHTLDQGKPYDGSTQYVTEPVEKNSAEAGNPSKQSTSETDSKKHEKNKTETVPTETENQQFGAVDSNILSDRSDLKEVGLGGELVDDALNTENELLLMPRDAHGRYQGHSLHRELIEYPRGLDGHAGIFVAGGEIIKNDNLAGKILGLDTGTVPVIHFLPHVTQNISQYLSIIDDFPMFEQYTIWRFAIFNQMYYTIFPYAKKNVELGLSEPASDELLDAFQIINARYSNFEPFHLFLSQFPGGFEYVNIDKQLRDRYLLMQQIEIDLQYYFESADELGGN